MWTNRSSEKGGAGQTQKTRLFGWRRSADQKQSPVQKPGNGGNRFVNSQDASGSERGKGQYPLGLGGQSPDSNIDKGTLDELFRQVRSKNISPADARNVKNLKELLGENSNQADSNIKTFVVGELKRLKAQYQSTPSIPAFEQTARENALYLCESLPSLVFKDEESTKQYNQFVQKFDRFRYKDRSEASWEALNKDFQEFYNPIAKDSFKERLEKLPMFDRSDSDYDLVIHGLLVLLDNPEVNINMNFGSLLEKEVTDLESRFSIQGESYSVNPVTVPALPDDIKETVQESAIPALERAKYLAKAAIQDQALSRPHAVTVSFLKRASEGKICRMAFKELANDFLSPEKVRYVEPDLWLGSLETLLRSMQKDSGDEDAKKALNIIQSMQTGGYVELNGCLSRFSILQKQGRHSHIVALEERKDRRGRSIFTMHDTLKACAMTASIQLSRDLKDIVDQAIETCRKNQSSINSGEEVVDSDNATNLPFMLSSMMNSENCARLNRGEKSLFPEEMDKKKDNDVSRNKVIDFIRGISLSHHDVWQPFRSEKKSCVEEGEQLNWQAPQNRKNRITRGIQAADYCSLACIIRAMGENGIKKAFLKEVFGDNAGAVL